MTFIRWRWESFALEYVTEVTTTGGASDLCAGHEVRLVFMPTDGSWNSVEESRPAATARELSATLVERSPTPSARINPLFLVVVVLSSARRFCALLTQNPKLLWGQDRPPLGLWLLLGSVGHGRR